MERRNWRSIRRGPWRRAFFFVPASPAAISSARCRRRRSPWNEEGGNSGLLVHLFPGLVGFKHWPPSLEVQLRKGQAGDFYVIGNKTGLVGDGSLFVAPGVPVVRVDRQDDAETSPTEWQKLKVVSQEGVVEVLVNGRRVNRVTGVRPTTATLGLQSEGAPIRFRSFSIEAVSP